MPDSFEDQLAAAFVAKMAGSTLAQIDSQTTKHSNQGPAARIDPRSFLVNIQQQQQEQKKREVERLNNLAEQMYPLPEPIQISELPPPTTIASQNTSEVSSELINVLKSIDSTLKEFVEIYNKTH